MKDFLHLAQTDANYSLQEARGSKGLYGDAVEGPAELSEHEIGHIRNLNSFYMATVNEAGWPYVQHRGGETGFVKTLDPTTIGWVERSGNRQYLGTGNITANGRVAMIFLDYAHRTRLKVLGTAIHHGQPTDDLLQQLNPEGHRIDGAITVRVDATAWNCPKYITPRVELDDVRGAVEHLQQRIAELEAENERLAAATTF